MRVPGIKTLRMTARWLRSRFSGGALILGYHRVACNATDPYGLCVCPRNFEAHLQVIRSVAEPVSLQELSDNLRNGLSSNRAVALTFDDGYVDVLQQGCPLLERYEIPATVFAVSGCLGATFPWDAAGNGEARESHASAMTGEQLAQLSGHPLFSIGSHSVNHRRLATLPVAEQQAEIGKSKETLEDLLGRRVDSFSYPHGSASRTTCNLVREAGYRYACTSFNDVVWRASDPLYLPRFWPGDWDGDRFERWLKWWLHS